MEHDKIKIAPDIMPVSLVRSVAICLVIGLIFWVGAYLIWAD